MASTWKSRLLYGFVRSQIAWLSLVAPVSVAVLLWELYTLISRVGSSVDDAQSEVYHDFLHATTAQTPLLIGILIQCWLVAEVVFYLFYLHHCDRLQDLRPHHPSTYKLCTPEERMGLLDMCLDTVQDLPAFLSKWFYGVPVEQIRKENVKDFLAWAFFSEAYEDMTDKKMLQELDAMIEFIQNTHKLPVADGRTPGVKCMRLSIDPVEPRHKPFFYYALVWILSQAFSFYFTRVLGFRRYSSFTEQQLLQDWSAKANDQSAPNFGYWYRPGSGDYANESPFVVFHGIGTGVFGYTFFLRRLAATQRPMFVVEMSSISTLFFPVYRKLSESVPTMVEMTEGIEMMLLRHGYVNTPCSMIGHSFGSVILTWLIKLKPQLLKKVTFVDPVCFLLHHPDVAYNFVYREPVHWPEWAIWWFASRELYVSWTLNRCFYWHQNSLFLHDIPEDLRVDIILGGSDCIVPSDKVRDYLCRSERARLYNVKTGQEHAFSITNTSRSFNPNVTNIFYFHELNHAEFLFNPLLEQQFASIVLDRFLIDSDKQQQSETLSNSSNLSHAQFAKQNTVLSRVFEFANPKWLIDSIQNPAQTTSLKTH